MSCLDYWYIEKGWYLVFFLETAGNILSAATAQISTKLKDNFVSSPLQNNRGQELFSALKQNFNLQAHPALLFICRALLVLVKVSAEVRKSYRVCRILPSHSLSPHLMCLGFPKLSDLSRWTQKYTGKSFQMLWFSVNISIMTGHFWCIITAAVEWYKLCLIWNRVSIHRIKKTCKFKPRVWNCMEQNNLSKMLLRQGKTPSKAHCDLSVRWYPVNYMAARELRLSQWGWWHMTLTTRNHLILLKKKINLNQKNSAKIKTAGGQ